MHRVRHDHRELAATDYQVDSDLRRHRVAAIIASAGEITIEQAGRNFIAMMLTEGRRHKTHARIVRSEINCFAATSG